MSQSISQKPRSRRVSPFSLAPWFPREVFELDQLFDSLVPNQVNPASQLMTRMDVSETDHAIEVQMDLPGVKPEDVEITIENNMVTIRGHRMETREEHDKNRQFHSVERSFGSFSRSFALPTSVKDSEAAAEFREGVLHVTFPKSEEVKPKKINIKSK
ncbi:MAG: Hsp20/alpha crystallin family protein [Pirellulaceae bacterium]|nr:Hsp20/alpha crystallin family protein [Pirellulaceae bacterium]